jgi:hypothetical protein
MRMENSFSLILWHGLLPQSADKTQDEAKRGGNITPQHVSITPQRVSNFQGSSYFHQRHRTTARRMLPKTQQYLPTNCDLTGNSHDIKCSKRP